MIGFMAFYFGGGTCNKQKVNGLKKGHIKINRHDCLRSFPVLYRKIDWFDRFIRILLFRRYRNKLAAFLMIIVFGGECRIFPRESIMKLG